MASKPRLKVRVPPTPLGERLTFPRKTWFGVEPLLKVKVSEIMLTGFKSGAFVWRAPPLRTSVAFPRTKALLMTSVAPLLTNTMEPLARSFRFWRVTFAMFPFT